MGNSAGAGSFIGRLVAGEGLVGTWSQIASADALEVLGGAGFDFTVIDTEHTAFGLERAQDLLRAADACGLPAMVRIAALEQRLMTKALDAGFRAVVVPGVRDAAGIATAIGWSRYGAGGGRGACPCIRAGGQAVTDWPGFARRSDSEVLCIPLIENRAAIEGIERIVAVEGVRVVMLGPFDLSVDMGLGGDLHHPRVTAAIERALAACAAHGVTPVLPLFDTDPAALRARMEEWRGRGVRVFMLGTDKLLLASIARILTV